jgi:hypothetical protein
MVSVVMCNTPFILRNQQAADLVVRNITRS